MTTVSSSVAAGISPLVVGLTVVAFGTSSPELAVTVQSAYLGQTEVAIGNVVGSNIANILLVLGISAAIGALVVAQKLVRVEVPLMIGLSLLVLFMGLDGKIGWQEGILLTFGALVYTAFLIRQSRKENQEIRAEYAHEFDRHVGQPTGFRQIVVQLGLIIGGAVMLIFGSRWLVDGAASLARLFGVRLGSDVAFFASGAQLGGELKDLVAWYRVVDDSVHSV